MQYTNIFIISSNTSGTWRRSGLVVSMDRKRGAGTQSQKFLGTNDFLEFFNPPSIIILLMQTEPASEFSGHICKVGFIFYNLILKAETRNLIHLGNTVY